MTLVRLTAAQALVRYLTRQSVMIDSAAVPFFAGAWAIFGHGNVAGLGEALHAACDDLPTFRAHNEQAMAHAAIAYAKQTARRRAFVCTSSIGPGATNMVTAAALAHVNRLPVLFLPGDVFASRRPDPVLQQIEDFGDGLISANDCFRPVSRYFDRITRPEQLLKALPRAMSVLTDPVECGPVTLSLCQDVQAEAYDWPEAFFAPRLWSMRRPGPDAEELAGLIDKLRAAKRPLIIVGGGVKYSGAEAALARLACETSVVFCETQAGKGALVHDAPGNLGAIGVTGGDPANRAAREADLILAVGTRLQDFTTGSAALFNPQAQLCAINVCAFDALKFNAHAVVGDARTVLDALPSDAISLDADWRASLMKTKAVWDRAVDALVSAAGDMTEARALGAVMRAADKNAIVVAAAGGLPGDLHKLWRTRRPGGYHMEYGYSCMGYEIAGGVGVAMAEPDRDIYVLVGDGSYLMMNSEIATAVMLGLRLTLIVIDNQGFGCIHRLQAATGNAAFNNRLTDSRHEVLPRIDFVAHAKALGAAAVRAQTPAELEAFIAAARARGGVNAIVVETDARNGLAAGGAWWDVAVPEVSDAESVRAARVKYEQHIKDRTEKQV